jgi:hypothetical protein
MRCRLSIIHVSCYTFSERGRGHTVRQQTHPRLDCRNRQHHGQDKEQEHGKRRRYVSPITKFPIHRVSDHVIGIQVLPERRHLRQRLSSERRSPHRPRLPRIDLDAFRRKARTKTTTILKRRTERRLNLQRKLNTMEERWLKNRKRCLKLWNQTFWKHNKRTSESSPGRTAIQAS